MNIIGIDPSLSGTAIYTGENYYLLETKKEKSIDMSIDYTNRIVELKNDIIKIILFHSPLIVGIEGISYGSVGRLVELGALSYFIRAEFIENNIPFIIIPPTVVKKYWTGKGSASKEMMINEALKRNISIPYYKKIKGQQVIDDNCVDATAIASFTEDYINGIIQIEYSGVEIFDPYKSFS